MNFGSGEDLGKQTLQSVMPHAGKRGKQNHSVGNGRSKKPTILVVDDETNKGQILSVTLKLAGFGSSFVGSAAEALEILETRSIDGIISDLKMPGFSGAELVKRVRKDHPKVAFLLFAERDDAHAGVQAVKDGADDFLIKPIQANDVVSTIKRCLERKRVEREVVASRKRIEQLVSKRTMQLRSALRSVEASYESALLALASALDLRDGKTGGHSRRVCEYSIEIAKRMGCSESQLKTLSHGALLHDIGKLAIPDSILLKPGALTSDEWIVMRGHVETGHELVSRIPLLQEVAELVLTHHERFDGTGYPRKLRGDQIPQCARIFAVADAFDAMTSPRPYQATRSISQAIAEIRVQAGRQFDPQVVAAFLDVPREVLGRIQAESKVCTAGNSSGKKDGERIANSHQHQHMCHC